VGVTKADRGQLEDPEVDNQVSEDGIVYDCITEQKQSLWIPLAKIIKHGESTASGLDIAGTRDLVALCGALTSLSCKTRRRRHLAVSLDESLKRAIVLVEFRSSAGNR
jgi:hypothetical protein